MVDARDVQQTIFAILDSGAATPKQVLETAQARDMHYGFDHGLPAAITAAVSAWSQQEMAKTRRQMALYGL